MKHSFTLALPAGYRVDDVLKFHSRDAESVAEEVSARLDGRHLNLDLPEFAYGRTLPSCEALARYLFQRIAPRLPAGVTLARVRVAEDASLHADCTGDT